MEKKIKYSLNIILNLSFDCPEERIQNMKSRIMKKNPLAKVVIINYQEDQKLDELKQLGSDSRLYILAHQNFADYFTDRSLLNYNKSEIKSWHYTELAKSLSDKLSHLKITENQFDLGAPRLTVSLIVCHAGFFPQGATILQSMGAKFHQKLAKYNLHVIMYVRRAFVCIDKHGKKEIGDPNLNLNIFNYFQRFLQTDSKEEKQDLKIKMLGNIKFYKKLKNSKVTFSWKNNAKENDPKSKELRQTVCCSYTSKLIL